MKLSYRSVLLSIILLLILGTNSLALPSLCGTTGLIRMPTAQGLKYKEFNIAMDYLPEDESSSRDSKVLYKANLGTLDGLEVGIVGENNQEGVFVNLKYYLMSDMSEDPLMMALGFENLSSFNQTDFYMVTSKMFGGGFSLHIGFLSTLQGETDTSLMLGTEYYFSESASIALDTIGFQEDYKVNAALRFHNSENIIFHIYSAHLIPNSVDSTTTDQNADAVMGIGITFTNFLE